MIVEIFDGGDVEGYISISSGSKEKVGLAAKIWMNYRGNIMQRFSTLDATWIIYANNKEVTYGTREDIPKPLEIEKLSRETGNIHYLFIFHPRVREVELTPELKKRQEDQDWWDQIGQHFINEEEHVGKYIGVRDRKILFFDRLEEVIKKTKTTGLSFAKKCEDKGVISIPSYDIVY